MTSLVASGVRASPKESCPAKSPEHQPSLVPLSTVLVGTGVGVPLPSDACLLPPAWHNQPEAG